VTANRFEVVARVSEIPDQATLAVTRANGERICLIRRGSRITAVHDICTHQEFSMSSGDVLSDGTIQCAWHGARFDCTTGEVKQVPATEPLPVYEVAIEGDQVLVGSVRPRSSRGFEPCVAEIGT
jgi:3-phenylpropionate/trans-cinnamate dioxygenase ferredoxin component